MFLLFILVEFTCPERAKHDSPLHLELKTTGASSSENRDSGLGATQATGLTPSVR